MNRHRLWKMSRWVSFIVSFILSQNAAYASHAQSADLTYRCLGGNQYELSLSFYRDCAGVAAPGSVTIDLSSVTCNQSFNATLLPIAGTGQDVSPICASMTTQCSGGSNPGVEEHVYRGIVTLPAACSDWVFSFNLCCRNSAITNIVNPGNENIYVEAHLDNLNFPCNSSPTFSNRPIPFVCVGQTYCFNHGAVDIDGDSLSYSLVAPATSPTTTVTYVNPYTAAQPLASSPAVTFNNLNGDICMTPSMLQVTVMAVRVDEWRNGQHVGSVVRDIQIRTITCNNNLPSTDGINGSNQFNMTGCTGLPISFNVNSIDPDMSQTVTMTWNSGIPGASFTNNGGARPVGVFTWTPSAAQVGTFCFTVTVTDDNCPYSGSQTYAFCITVNGVTVSATATATNCGASNGTASATVLSGNGPYSYQWLPGGGNNASANGLQSGTYTVNVTDAGGCIGSATVVVPQGPANTNLNTSVVDIACFGNSTGSATVNANGGQQPYTYLWSNGGNASTISNLIAGTYSVTVTTANGCINTATVVVTQPASALSSTASVISNVSCFGSNNGSASVNTSGGTAPYTYSWSTNPQQQTVTASSLNAGSYSCTVIDANGCSVISPVTITQPAAITVSTVSSSPVSCNGGSNGSATVNASGGTGNFTYSWNSTPPQSGSSAGNLTAGSYTVTATDASGCAATQTVSITQPTVLIASMATSSNVTCFGGNNGSATAGSSGGTPPYTYSWNSGPNTPSASNLTAGGYTVTVTDANGCATVSTVTITQPTAITVTVSGGDTVCPGQNSVISVSASGGTGTYSYQWNNNLGNSASHTVSTVNPTNYLVTVTDANGCSTPAPPIFIDVYQFTAASLTMSPNTAVCAGLSANVQAFVTGNTGPLTYVWSNSSWNGPGPYSATPAATTNYVVTVTNGCGVQVSSQTVITVHPLPVMSLPSPVVSGCDAAPLTLTDTASANAGSTYLWYFGDSGTGYGANVTHTYTQSGVYTIDVQVTSPFGCTAQYSTQAAITVNVSAVAVFQPSVTETSILEPTVIFQNQSQNAFAWSWNFGDGDSATSVNAVHEYAAKGIYNVRLIAFSATGCHDTTTIPVEITPEFTLYIPNAFTPNGDGINDVFLVYGDEFTDFKMRIYDRWGQMIYGTDDPGLGWNGKANEGRDVSQQDVFVYAISVHDFRGLEHKYKGTVTLVR